MRLIDWTVELNGSSETLEHLAEILPEGPTRVERRGGHFFLKLDSQREVADPLVVENAAAAAIRAALGALNAFANIVGDVGITRLHGVDQHGANLGAGPYVRMNVRVTSAEGKERLAQRNTGKTIAARLVTLATSRPEVARALSLLENRDPSWADIYVLMEMVDVELRAGSRPEVKDWRAIKEKRWIRTSDIETLKKNAGFHRHAKQRKPPSPAMPLWRAQVLCKAVVRRWLEEISAG